MYLCMHACRDDNDKLVLSLIFFSVKQRTKRSDWQDNGVMMSITKFGDTTEPSLWPGPFVWNSLPAAVREADSWYLFKHKLKTHLFTLCFND